MTNPLKASLASNLKNWMANLKPEDIGFGDIPVASVEYQNESNLGACLRIKLSTGPAFYFEIKVKEIY